MKANFLGVKNVISRASFLNLTPLGSVGKSHVSCDETSLQRNRITIGNYLVYFCVMQSASVTFIIFFDLTVLI